MHGTDDQGARLCPNCRSPLKAETFEGIELDICETCAGIWFDMGELRRLMGSEQHALIKTEDRVKPSGKPPMERSDAPRLCPCCRQPMEPYRYMHASFIWLDGCQRCSGIWADDGELQLIEEWLLNRSQRVAACPEDLAALDAYATEHQRLMDQKRAMVEVMKWWKMRVRM